MNTETVIITKSEIIMNLHSNPKNDFEIGQNSVLIDLLKKGTLTDEHKSFANLLNGLPKEHISYLINHLNEATSLIHYKKNNEKLAAVKLYKEVFGIGLKEAKEYMDEFFIVH